MKLDIIGKKCSKIDRDRRYLSACWIVFFLTRFGGIEMRHYIKIYVIAICVVLSAYSGVSHSAEIMASEYMTVEEYQKLHPEEVGLMQQFEEIVRAPGDIIGIAQDRPVRIAFIYPGHQASDYWRRSVASFKGRMDEIGLKYDLSEYFTTISSDTRTQEEQLRDALSMDPDYLVYTLYIGKHKRLIERMLTRGRPKLIMQNITTPLRSWEGNQPFMYVGFDHATGSYLLADHYLNTTGKTGSYSVLHFSRGYISVMRGDTFVDYVGKHSDKKLVDAYYTEASRTKAKAATEDILNGSKVDFIYACSTDIALGGLDALKEMGMVGQVPINGWGGGSAELEAIAQGELDVTVMRMNDDNGVAMAEAIRLDLEGNDAAIPTVYSGDFILVEKGIAPKRLDELIRRAFRYSGTD